MLGFSGIFISYEAEHKNVWRKTTNNKKQPFVFPELGTGYFIKTFSTKVLTSFVCRKYILSYLRICLRYGIWLDQ